MHEMQDTFLYSTPVSYVAGTMGWMNDMFSLLFCAQSDPRMTNDGLKITIPCGELPALSCTLAHNLAGELENASE